MEETEWVRVIIVERESGSGEGGEAEGGKGGVCIRDRGGARCREGGWAAA